jgi:hypothetical protein
MINFKFMTEDTHLFSAQAAKRVVAQSYPEYDDDVR